MNFKEMAPIVFQKTKSKFRKLGIFCCVFLLFQVIDNISYVNTKRGNMEIYGVLAKILLVRL